MSRFARIASSSIGKKLLMAATGLGMVFWLLGHLAGNLKIFLGAREVNEYAAWLQDHAALLWFARISMLAFIGIHIRKGIQLALENRKARPKKYQVEATLKANFASRHMVLSGVILFLFLAMHLAHYTFRVLPVEYRNDSMGNPDVYAMVIAGFKDPGFCVVYVLGLGVPAFGAGKFNAARERDSDNDSKQADQSTHKRNDVYPKRHILSHGSWNLVGVCGGLL